ncbi:MAG: 50S ribosomal protein L22, partial [Nitrospinae bacterium]|nr:50S ribosomal protein L22 [Nitrospinota bacterium]
MEVKAQLRHTRTAPRKARLVADLIRGKNVNDAINILAFTRKRAADKIQKLLKSAIANAEENHKILDVDDLVIKNVQVDEGVTWKRNMPRARGT